VAVGADHDIDAGYGRWYTNVLAVREPSVLAFLHPAMAERDDDVYLLRLAEGLHHIARGLDGISKFYRASAAGIKLGFLAEQPEDAKAHAAAFDDKVAADHTILGQLLQACQCWVAASKIAIRCDHRRDVAGLGGRRDALGRTIRPEVEIMVAEGCRVAAHAGQQL